MAKTPKSVLDCVALVQQNPAMEGRCNALADTLLDSGALIEPNNCKMIIFGLPHNDILTILNSQFGVDTHNIPEGILT